jgi:radical SAM protein (TIGR01212 family)
MAGEESTPMLPFQTLAPWLEMRFSRPISRIALDAGSSCPNRDGTRGFGGCTYCDVEGSGTGALKSGVELAAQLDAGLRKIARRPDGAGAIAYLQSYSNTYVSPARLDEVLGVVEARLGNAPVPIVAFSIATRPDTLPDWAIERLLRLQERVEVWVELGLESASDEVLSAIRRLHTLAEFEDAAERLARAGLLGVGHAILGLPGDGRIGAQRTAEALARSALLGVKVHHLMVLKTTQLAVQYRRGEIELLDEAQYIEWLADFTERLRPDQVLHRITGDSPAEALIAPAPNFDKNRVREGLARTLRARGTRQGSRYPATRSAL